MAHIVLTRPLGQSMRLGELLSQQLPELKQIQLPLLSIVPNESSQDAKRLQDLLPNIHLAVFVSPNAIECTMRLLKADWPTTVPIAVVGGGSVEALERRGITVENGYQIYYPKEPENWDSEGLWAELKKASVDWANQHILFLKGAGGRAWLSEQFLRDGAQIHHLETYRRVPLSKDAPVWHTLKTVSPEETACLMTSSEGVRHMTDVLKEMQPWGQEWLNLATMICSHPRIAQTAQELGFKKVECCNAGDNQLVLAAQRWVQQLK